MNNHVLATLCTYDSTDCVSTGFDLTLYGDGSVAAQSWSCWQGSRHGQRWRTAAGYVDIEMIDALDPHLDADAALADIAERIGDELETGSPVWRCTRRGHIVQ